MDYKDAKPHLVARLGLYCSFCERRVVTQLAVEHIQPKGLPIYSHLIGCWSNFLLACVNCNSTKKNRDVDPESVLLPDRDNTFSAFHYLPDGTIVPSGHAVSRGLQAIADKTLHLTGLDKTALNTPDENGRQVALDRMKQRMEAWLAAEEAKNELQRSPENGELQRYIVKLAVQTGFFSVWMTVFMDHSDMLSRFIRAFTGTWESGCFGVDGLAVSPAPNPDGLPGGGKI
ncbi:hypothetical protein [Desulfobotulus mexicanus]|nr:hypothetical protein [Desulfobotulus mexicanus]